MGKYGSVAVLAVKKLYSKEYAEPAKAWQSAAEKIFLKESSINKGCPKLTFLSLCQHGLIRGIVKGTYTNARENKKYALDAVNLLKVDPVLADDEAKLRLKVMGKEKAYNQQMEVVIALWREGLINI